MEIDIRQAENTTVDAIRFTANLRIVPATATSVRVVDDLGATVMSLTKAQLANMQDALTMAHNLWLTP